MYIIRVISLKQFKYLATKVFVVNVYVKHYINIHIQYSQEHLNEVLIVRSAFHCIADSTCHLFVYQY